MSENRFIGWDFLKVIATIMITNSHFIPLYKNHNIAYATLGVQGNALFFFIAGFFSLNIVDKTGISISCWSWIKKKLSKLWPTIIVYFILANLLFREIINWKNFILFGSYWFVRCLLISYLIIYFILKYLNNYIKIVFYFSILLTILIVCFSDKVSGSIFHDHNFHYFCYFSTMLFGVLIRMEKSKIKNYNFIIDLSLTFFSFVSYFVIMSFGKNKINILYYTQLLGMIPLFLFLFYSYKTVVNRVWPQFLSNKSLIWIISFIASLTYEIYIVQFSLITDYFNSLYPFNTIIVFGIILLSAYLLYIIKNLFIMIIGNRDSPIKNIFLLK